MSSKNQTKLSISQASFGKSATGVPADLFTLTNAHGLMVKITNFGGIITEIHVPDKNGEFTDVNLGFDHIEPYYKEAPYFGALVGRVGNRIAGGKFSLDGKTYELVTNDGNNHLHGGLVGFDKVVWNASAFETENSVGLKLNYLSVDGDQGYPGNLDVTVTYELTNTNEILVKYHAVTDKATPINLTQHAYFNLAGKGGDILDHEVMINADHFTAIDSEAIPTGKLPSVENTPFDFRSPRVIGERINDDDEQLKNGNGYDHNFVLNKVREKELSLAARVYEKTSGRVLEVFTEEPGIQFYTGNWMDGSLTGKGWHYTRRCGLCLEPQHFPDSPNRPEFPNTILRPGEQYSSAMSYKFSVQS
ncbi:MAG: galactose mutarotase [Chitinophagaceae bacterium]|nr:MAG: galactose mutarotase [Chitinophagaceae bacterium]